MTEPYASDLHPARAGDDDKVMPVAVYVLYLLGWATGPITPFVGFIMAYALKGKAAPWARSHYVFAIRTAWLALIGWVAVGLLIALGTPLTLILVGFLIWKVALAFAVVIGVWVTVRAAVGLIYASRCEAYPRPDAWII
jgi:uncharacterized membrane protein